MNEIQDLEIYKCLCEFSTDALYVLDPEADRIILANSAFERISGYTRTELSAPDFDAKSLIPPEERDRLPWEADGSGQGSSERIEGRLVTKTGEMIDVEFAALNTPFNRKTYRLGSIRDVSDRKNLETKLKDEVSLHRRNTIEAAKSSVRIYQLTERIRNVPNLVTGLLNSTTADELFREAARTLCEKDGLAYAGVSFFIREGNELTLAYSTTKKAGRRYNLQKNTRHAKAINEGMEITQGGTTILPLKSREEAIGLMEILFDENERILFDESESVKQGQRDIIRTVAHIIGLMIENLRLYDKVKQQSILDGLTSTYNRRYFDQNLTDEFQRAMRYRRDLSVVIIDLDNFKIINDSHGHLQGDVVLKEVAEIFRKSSRDVDTICRYGGDEFVLLLPETNKSRAQAKAENLRRLIESHPFTRLSGGDEHLFISISIGVSSLTPGTPDQIELFRAADEALYDAKRLGRNLVCTAGG
ncbi:MAG: diguanylate cyclase [Planctomycetota bacterium]|nr:diguanylate cyclase [Planctomycetota bacterium]